MSKEAQELERRFEDFLPASSLVSRGDSLILAVSGGVDSTVMTRLFVGLRERWDLTLAIAHVNHQLRGEESDGDERFVMNLAALWKIPLYCSRVDTLGHTHTYRLSKQVAARDLRYRFFEDVRTRIEATAVATAHHADDNAETVLLNALRGAGVRGLAGIPIQRKTGKVIRPLLFARRSEIEAYASDNRLEYRTDSSNDSLEYRRNYIRRKIFPLLASEGHPDVVGPLNRVALLMRQLLDRIEAEVDMRWDSICGRDDRKRTVVNIPGLLSEPLYLQEEIVLRVLRGSNIEPQAEKVKAVLDLCTRPTGRSVQLSHSTAAYRDRDALVFVVQEESGVFRETVSPGEVYSFPAFQFSLSHALPPPESFEPSVNLEYVDADRLGKELLLRMWEDGDWFMPLGTPARKKLSDFFTDEKVPVFEKSQIPVLVSAGSIVWICGHRLDDRFKVTPQTRAVIRLQYNPTTPLH